MSNVKIVRMAGNQELIAKVVIQENGSLELHNPLMIRLMPTSQGSNELNVGLGAAFPLTDDDIITLSPEFVSKNVICQYNPAKDILTKYNEATSSLILPNQIITG